MVERARRPRLLLEAAQRLLAVRTGREHLHRHLAPELAVESDEDAAHAALAQLALDLVAIGDDRRGRRGPAARIRQSPGPAFLRCGLVHRHLPTCCHSTPVELLSD